MVNFNIPGMTTKQFDDAWKELRALGISRPKGLVHHTGAQNGSSMVIVDVWESQEAWEGFAQTIGPILGKLGVADSPPVILPVHYDLT